MLKRILALSFFCCNVVARAAQPTDSVAQVVYLLGNTATAALPAAHLQAFKQQLQQETQPFTILHLGDVLANQGLTAKLHPATTAKLDQLLALTKVNPRGKLYFIPGDKDWGNSRPEGLANVRRLEQYIRAQRNPAAALVPGNGCPGPAILDMGPHLRIIAINTQWWLHPYQKPAEPATDCNILSSQEFVETVQDAIDEAAGRHILLVGHHPVVSNGVYGGHVPWQKHLFPLTDFKQSIRLPLPVLGSLYAAYRQNVGTPRDMAYPNYQQLITDLNRVLKVNDQLIYAAAHDYSLQLNARDRNYHLVAGSFTQKEFVSNNPSSLFNQAATGYAKITFFTDGKVTTTFYQFNQKSPPTATNITLFQSACAPDSAKNIPVNQHSGPCIEPDIPAPATVEDLLVDGNRATVAAGPRYAAPTFKRKVFGNLYRPSWTQPVRVPLLHLSRTREKLRPLKAGGGRQTTALRLQAADGRQYVFRSVDKDPAGALPPELRNTVATDVLREITPTGHPYGALIASRLLDSTDILHARPRLYVLADDPALGAFRQNYKGLFGMLEERPLGPRGNRPGFAGAAEIRNTFDLFREIYRDLDHRVDARAYGKARAFDILIGDWGRHPDNWRWAGNKIDSQVIYRPIPRDRDHAFSRWDGFIPWLADREWGVPNIQNFDADLSGLRSLTWPARHLDRFLLTALTRQDWLNLARELQTTFTDPVIDGAIAALPPELVPRQGQEIGQILKARRARLPAVLEQYYELLARYVDVVGSNQAEYFKVMRLPGSRVRVQVFKKNQKTNLPRGVPVFDRLFLRSETKEIRLYGLDGQDVFDVDGQATASIRIRIIGGNGADSVRDASGVKSYRRHTLVYDNLATKLDLGREARNLTADDPAINFYSPTAFAYHAKSPSGSLIYNESDGVGLAFGVAFKRQHFRKKDFGSIYALSGRVTQFGNRQLTSTTLWRHVWRQWDLGTYLDAGYYFRTYDFFGLGNDTRKDETRYDAKHYKARFGGFISAVFLQRQFFQKSFFRVGPLYETLTTDFKSDSFLGQNAGELAPINTARQQLIGLNTEFSLDLRDKLVFTQRGLRVFVRHNAYQRLKSNDSSFGLTEGFLDYYGTGRVFLPVTLALRLGGARNYGRDLPYYKYTTLGLRPNLRGYVINRFAGDASLYLNSELRLHVGEVPSAFLPFRYGLIAFFDRGRVWYQGKSAGNWHDGYGGGFYVAPVAERFAFSLLLQHSREEPLLFSFGAGFRFDQ